VGPFATQSRAEAGDRVFVEIRSDIEPRRNGKTVIRSRPGRPRLGSVLASDPDSLKNSREPNDRIRDPINLPSRLIPSHGIDSDSRTLSTSGVECRLTMGARVPLSGCVYATMRASGLRGLSSDRPSHLGCASPPPCNPHPRSRRPESSRPGAGRPGSSLTLSPSRSPGRRWEPTAGQGELHLPGWPFTMSR
jgi:hypothetical protein